MFKRVASLVLLLAGCESGLTRSVKVTIPSEIDAKFSAESPALLVADLGSQRQAYVVLCGQGLKNPVYLSQDLGFGCLGMRDGTSENVRVWIEPISADAGVRCGVPRSFFNSFEFGPQDGGVGSLANEPAATWAQGSGSGTWRRDISPCGGVLSVDVTLAVP
jgi:hypothetical protein